jgi:hypothetical protein
VSLLDTYQRQLAQARTNAAKHLTDAARASTELSKASQRLGRTKSPSTQSSIARQMQTLEKKRAAALTKQAKAATDVAKLEKKVAGQQRQEARRLVNPSSPSPAVVESVAGLVAADPVAREHDVYLCYASPDVDLARELHGALVTHDLDVWFDKMNLDLGVSQTRQMDQGIARCRVGVLLVTPAFLEGRRWTEKEWTALVGADKRVIPVVAGTSFGKLGAYSPMLADLAGLNLDDLGPADVADAISETLTA